MVDTRSTARENVPVEAEAEATTEVEATIDEEEFVDTLAVEDDDSDDERGKSNKSEFKKDAIFGVPWY